MNRERRRRVGILWVVGVILFLFTSGVLAMEQKVVRWRIWGEAEWEMNSAIARAFEEQRPDIDVQLELPGPGSYHDKILVELIAGTAPDIFSVHHLLATTFHKAGVLRNLYPWLERDAVDYGRDDVVPSLIQAMERSGELTALPTSFVTMQVWFNKTLFDEVGAAYPYDRWDWERLRTEGRKFVRDINGDGNYDRWALTINRGYEFLTPWIGANHGKTVDDVDEPTEILLDSPNVVETIQYLRDLIHVDQIASPPSAGGGHQLFYNGQIAMWPYYYDAHRYQLYVGDQFEWDVAPFFEGFHGPAPQPLMVSGLTVSKSSQNPEAAWDFLKFITSAEGERIQREFASTLPRRYSTMEDFLDDPLPPDNKRIYAELLQPDLNAPWERFDGWLRYNTVINEEFAPMWEGTVSVENAIENAKRRGEAILFGTD